MTNARVSIYLDRMSISTSQEGQCQMKGTPCPTQMCTKYALPRYISHTPR